MKTSVIDVGGMLSVLSVLGVEERIGKVPGVESGTVNYAARSATVRYDETRLNVADIKSAVRQSGYESAAPAAASAGDGHEGHTAPGAPPSAPVAAAPKAPSVAPAAVPKASSVAPATVPAPAASGGDGQQDKAAPDAPPSTPPPAMAKAGRLDDPSVKNADEVARSLGADISNGLTAPEAARRLAQGGPNELRSAPRPPAWRRVLSHFHDPLVYLLLAAVAIALVAWVIEGLIGWPVDAIVIAIVVLLNAALGYVQEAKAQDAVAALARMTAATSAVLRDGQVRRVPSAELVRGDVLVLGEGDAVGADARLVQTTSLCEVSGHLLEVHRAQEPLDAHLSRSEASRACFASPWRIRTS